MKLSDFMENEKLDDAQMASLIGDCSEFAVKKWRYGERTPRLPQMQRIALATNGKVTPNDFAGVADAPREDPEEVAPEPQVERQNAA